MNSWFSSRASKSKVCLTLTPNLPTNPTKIARPQAFQEIPYGHENSTP